MSSSALKRKEVVTTAKEAAQRIEDGMSISIGGFGTVNHSMAVIREIIRKGTKNLTVIGAATGGLEIDMLIGAGCVKKAITPYVGGEVFCPIGNCFRKAVEQGEIELWECSEYILYAGLYAQSMGLGFMPWRGVVGTDIPKLNPDLVEFEGPIDGEKYLAIPPINPDWAIIHTSWADVYGNGQHVGAIHGDRLFARAATRVMLTVEKIVPNDIIRRDPFKTFIPYADIVVESPFGSHPFASHGFYREDVEHIKEYVRVTEEFRHGNPAPGREDLDKYVYGPEDHEQYLEVIGIRRLMQLREEGGFSL